jgi:hypothetical protein
MVKRKANHRKLPPALAKGQLWKLGDAYIEILEPGKRLIEYRMLKHLGQMGVRTRMTGIPTLENYLRTNEARLVKGSKS